MANVWKRESPDSDYDYGHRYRIKEDSFETRFSDLPANVYLDIYVKRIALRAAGAIVCVKIYSGEKEVRCGSGFIIDCDTTANGQFLSTIITSASLLKSDAAVTTLVDDLKVVVVLSGGEQYDGDVEAYDFHYNLASVKIGVDHSLEIARLRHVDDSIMVDPSMISFAEARPLRPHSDLFSLVPGSRVVALGRYHDDESDIMIAPGEFSLEKCRLDCKELLSSTCRITKCGIGGPLVNRNAEVIGVNFIVPGFTPFLPINIVAKWWNYFNKIGDYRQPWLGMDLSNLFTVEVTILEKMSQKFPNIKTGMIVDEVTPNSPAGSAGVHPNDIIIECDGKAVESSLQFFDLTWDKVGKPVDLVVIRTDGSHLSLSVVVADVSPNQFNCWPLPRRC